MFEYYDARLAICHTCDQYHKPANKCLVCGCFLSMKAALPGAKCPLNLWQIKRDDDHVHSSK